MYLQHNLQSIGGDRSLWRGLPGKMVSVILLFTSTCLTSTAVALNEHEWRYKIVNAYKNLTKYSNPRDIGKYRELFADNTELLIPRMPLAHNKEVMIDWTRFLAENRVAHMYTSFAELLYWSPDVAITRHTEFTEFLDGRDRTAFGLAMLIPNGNGVKFKLGIYTRDWNLKGDESASLSSKYSSRKHF